VETRRSGQRRAFEAIDGARGLAKVSKRIAALNATSCGIEKRFTPQRC
jgi:hypothetical protein